MEPDDRILCFGEILWDVLPDRRLPGGAPMNVALHLKKLDLQVRFVSRVGDDQWGAELKQYLDTLGFSNYWLQRDKEYPTGWAEVDLSDSNNPQYRFPDCAWDHIELDSDLTGCLHQSDIFVYGSLVARSAKSRQTLMDLLKEENTYKVFDVNLRKPNYSIDLIESLLGRADLVKMNAHELSLLEHWFFKPADEPDLLRNISERFDCPVVTVTHGEEGASMLFQDQYYRCPGYSTRVVDTIGAGDAFLAGLLKGFLKDFPPRDILSFACATGACVVSHPGANPDYTMEDIDQLMNRE